MEDLKRKYARFLIKGCLRLNAGDKLFIIASSVIEDFVDVVRREAFSLGIKDVEIQINNPFLQKEKYLTKTYDEIIQDPLFDKTKYNQMAVEGYAFLSLSSPVPGIFEDVDSELFTKVNTYQMKSMAIYKEYQLKGKIKWCIAAASNSLWAKDILGDSEDRLWDVIYDICLIKENDPILAWRQKTDKLKRRAHYLNELQIDKLIYYNGLGTRLEIGLPKDYLFQSADEGTGNGVLVNMPTEEVFTSPDRLRVNGKVYSSKPLLYNGTLIDNFWLEFQDGKIVDYDASKGREILQGIIETDLGSHYLGEVALVDFSSPISLTNILFKNTLYDENASCHLAIGEGFPECIKDGLELSSEKLLAKGINMSHKHVDFFVGTRDLEVKAVLQNGRETVIMKDGNFVEV